MEEPRKEINLKLGVENVNKNLDKKLLDAPRYYHFNESVSPKDFHEATLITYTRPDGKEVVIKDMFNRRS